jgi:hypothetical protein
MAYNDKKILQVLVGEVGKVPERCEGYREELGHLLGDVLNYEREHAITKTNVVKKIADQVNTVGMFVYKRRAGAVNRQRDG